MSYRAKTLLAVLVTFAWATSSLHAQSLTADEEAKLDGRFERIVQLEEQGTLESEIEAFSKRVRARPSDRREAPSSPLRREDGPEVMSKDGASRLQSDATQDGASLDNLSMPLLQDLRPSARRPDGTPIYEALVRTDDASALSRAGVQVNSAFDGVVTARVTPSDVRALSQLEEVDQVRTPRRLQPHNDEAAAEIGARTVNEGVGGTAYRGQDVMVCVIDSGIDWSHPDFTDANGDTRIHSIWDQPDDSTSTSSPAANDGSRFGSNFNPDYGSEYLTSDVQNGNVNQKDRNGHGTHVTGTVASSGQAHNQSSGTKKYTGVAPDANIIAVKTLFFDTNIADGINYCQDVAESEGKPVVVNMSLGSDFAPHDGTSFLAQAIDNITNDGSDDGTAVVTSAGNSGSPFNPIHTSGSIASGDSVDVPLTVPAYDTTSGAVNDFYETSLWTYEDTTYSVSVYTPGNQDTLTVSIDSSGAVVDSTIFTSQGAIYVESATNISGSARYFFVQSFDASSTQPPAEGEWTVRLRNEGNLSTEYHGWFLSSSMGASFQNADNFYTIGSPATSNSAIAVGAYVHRQRWSTTDGTFVGFPAGAYNRDNIAPFSSRGPTVDGRRKPAVTAPGAYTASALSDDAFPSPILTVGDGEHQVLSGTSMSSPATAGAVALLMQANPSLTTNQARSLLTGTARSDDRVLARGGAWNPAFGFGKVDVLHALTQLNGTSDAFQTEVLAYEDAFGNAFDSPDVTSDSVGEMGPDRFALRFTPSEDGPVTGVYVSTGFNNALTDSLHVQVWSDDGNGLPDAPLGDTVAVPAERLTPYTPNFLSLRDAQVNVSPGEDYHVVLEPKANGGTLEVLAETVGSTAGRSTAFDGSAWSETGNDLSIRVQVDGNLSTPDQTPPALATNVRAKAYTNRVEVDWTASTAADVATYRIYRDTAPIDSAAGPGTVTAYDTVSAATTSYTDLSVSVDTQYHYRVTAVDDSLNESGFSSEATATPVRSGITVSKGWNLVSVPLEAPDPSFGALLPDCQSAFAFQPGTGYVSIGDSDPVAPGLGFWANCNRDTVSVSGGRPLSKSVDVSQGWNIVGPFADSVDVQSIGSAPSGIVESRFYGFETVYRSANWLEPGKGYWVKTSGSGTLDLADTSGSKSAVRPALAGKSRSQESAESSTARLTVTDASGQSATLQVARDLSEEQLTGHLLPPKPPSGLFDVRFGTGRSAASFGGKTESAAEAFRTIELQGATYPVTLRLQDAEEEQAVRIQTGPGDSETKLTADEPSMTLEKGDGQPKVAFQTLPAEFALKKHYPNPASERATVEYAVPEATEVTIEVYDILGRRVAQPVKGRKKAGSHTAEIVTDRLSSGTYFYRMRAGDFQKTRRVVVVK